MRVLAAALTLALLVPNGSAGEPSDEPDVVAARHLAQMGPSARAGIAYARMLRRFAQSDAYDPAEARLLLADLDHALDRIQSELPGLEEAADDRAHDELGNVELALREAQRATREMHVFVDDPFELGRDARRVERALEGLVDWLRRTGQALDVRLDVG